MAPKYNPQWFVPPQAVRNNAERGLEMRKKTGRGGLTPAQASNAGAKAHNQRSSRRASSPASFSMS